jgi:SPASM domain peptide maturase of grasp-with-spasm system
MGIKRCSILDVSRNKLYFINSDYYELFEILSKKKISDIVPLFESKNDVENFDIFLKHLYDLELGIFVDDISLFPPIKITWKHPSIITNAIIDIRHIFHDFNSISMQLNELRCKFLQIRSYRIMEIYEVTAIMKSLENKSVLHVIFFMKYNENRDYYIELENVIKKNISLHITVYNTPEDLLSDVFFTDRFQLNFTSTNIQSSNCCGNINEHSFITPSIQTYMENLLYNGCLNRKISVDENGDIRNCPSMKPSYGNILNVSLAEVVNDKRFKKMWFIKKSEIHICKDCEYRCICTDCRSFLTEPDNIYSKPLKCSYSPHTLKWE